MQRVSTALSCVSILDVLFNQERAPSLERHNGYNEFSTRVATTWGFKHP